MPVQTTYPASRPIAIEGMVADASRMLDVQSRAAYETIAAGRFVCRQADGICRLPAASGDVTNAGTGHGVAMYDATKPPGAYAQYDMVPIVHHGRVYVVTEDACTAGGAVYVRHTANGGNTVIGGFRATTDTGAALLPNACWRSSASGGGLAVVELNSP